MTGQGIRTILKLIMLCLGIMLLYYMFQGRRSLNILGLKDGIKYLWRKKILLMLFTALFMVSYCFAQYLYSSRSPMLSVKFNYEEASKGLNPNGTRFNTSDILSDEVLKEVIVRGNYNVDVRELAESLSIISSYDGREISGSSILSIATEYKIAYSPTFETASIEPEEMLNLLADVYYEKFITNYSENDIILALEFDELNDMDYMDIDDYFRVKAQKLEHYITNYSYENSSYRLAESGETFSSLARKISNFIDVELERYSAYVLDNGLSKSASTYITQMEYENRLLQVDYEKKMAAYNVRLETIDMYDEQMARIVLVPTTDDSYEYYMSSTKIGVDYFAKDADNALQEATDIKEEMEHKAYTETQIENSMATSEIYKKADAMIVSLREELTNLAKQCKELSDSYINDKRNGYLQISLYEKSFKSMLGLKKGAIYSLVFLFLLGAFLAMREVCREEKRKSEA